MHLRTPRRYTRGLRRSPFSLRWWWLWLLTPLVVVAGMEIYNQRASLAPPVQQALYSVMQNAGDTFSTAIAPTATPTENPTNRLGVAEADWSEGRIESAVDNYLIVLDGVPNDVEVYYRATFGLLMAGQNEQAMTIAERTVTANPFSPDAWAIRAMALNRNNRYGESIASALQALVLQPNHARALAFLAESYYDISEFELAQSTIDRALEVDPNSFEALRVRGVIARDVQFDVQTARDYFQEAYELAPNMPYLGIELARLDYLALEAPDEALTLLNEIVELNPNNPLALYEMGNLYYRIQGNFSQAAELLRRCLDANPNSISCNALLGRVQISLEDYSGAIISLTNAVELGTTSAYHYFWLGRALRASGQCAEAIPYLQQSLTLAQEQGRSDVTEAATEFLRECNASTGQAVVTPTPEATVEGQGGSA